MRAAIRVDGTDHAGENLMGADLRDADLAGADLHGAFLIGADLRGADLRASDFLGADLRAADLGRADLTDAIFLTPTQVSSAKGDAGDAPSSVDRPPPALGSVAATFGHTSYRIDVTYGKGAVMTEEMTDVLVAGYQSVEAATGDFDGLMQLVADGQVEIEGAILVTHDPGGDVTVVEHGDHLGRKGLGWGAGAGLVVGLFAPPLLGAVAVGAAAGGLVGKFTQRKVEAGMEDLAEQLPPGTAGVITVFDDEHRLAVEQALPNSPGKSIAQTDKEGVRALKDGARHGDGQIRAGSQRAPDPRSAVRRHGGPYAQGVRRGLGHDPRSEGARGRPERAARASSTMRGSVRSTRSAVRSARRPSRACRRWASRTTRST